MKYTIDQKIWHIKINKFKDEPKQYSCNKNGIKIEELKIIGISNYKICLNNDWFTSLDNDDIEGYRKDRSYKTYLDDVNVNIQTGNSILGDGIFISLYSTKPPTKKILDKMVASASNEIDKKFGFLMKGVVNELWEIVDNYENNTI